ncbi:MAG: hypothetical protein OWQ59_09820 [Alicyclobacillaceae bacterium]|nr:hypothetical protein [Alicyclobacillaceae bacterium]
MADLACRIVAYEAVVNGFPLRRAYPLNLSIQPFPSVLPEKAADGKGLCDIMQQLNVQWTSGSSGRIPFIVS